MKDKIVIAGYGAVGQAHEYLLEKFSFKIQVVDPDYYRKTWKDVGFNGKVFDYNPQAVIICVSTPQNTDGSCNIDNVVDVLNDILKPVPIMIKSTLSIEGWRKITAMFSHLDITYSPEYLRQENAIQDFEFSKEISLGGGDIAYWDKLWKYCCKKVVVREPEQLILGKSFRNAFLATKVNFFNQVYDMCKACNIDYEQVRQEVTNDNRIGPSHSFVSKERGFGGHCFPKDTVAILKSADTNNVDLNIIRSAVEYNNEVRKSA
tara:strand:- start:1599 stop:2384 length:786 start_codon:yes stop_codon:yes gene_type:complete